MVDSLGGRTAPSEGAVAGAQDSGRVARVQAAFLKCLNNYTARVFLVILLHFLRRQFPRARDGAVEVIGMGGAKAWKVLPRLRPRDGVRAVRMHHAAQGRERTVQFQMGLCI